MQFGRYGDSAPQDYSADIDRAIAAALHAEDDESNAGACLHANTSLSELLALFANNDVDVDLRHKDFWPRKRGTAHRHTAMHTNILPRHTARDRIERKQEEHEPPPLAIPMRGARQQHQESEDVGTIIRRMKKEERKIRNRAAAQRSNLRNRAWRERLETELRKARDQACRLRKREEQLLEVNYELKCALQQSENAQVFD